MAALGLTRLQRKPSPEDWHDDEPMTFQEYIAVFYPEGPLTVATLRNEMYRGRLTPAMVAGRYFVTPAQVKGLFAPCLARQKVRGSTSAQPVSPAQGLRSRKPGLSETERMKSAQAAVAMHCKDLMALKPS